MPKTERLPEIIVFAGPNGSGKSTVTRIAKVVQPYINADDIKTALNCSDLEAAQVAEKCVMHKSMPEKGSPSKRYSPPLEIWNY